MTTLAGSSEPGTADGAGAVARFKFPTRLALDERGRLLVAELDRSDTLRVVEASLAPPLWMGPLEEAVVTVPAKAHAALVALQQGCFKMVGDSELADVVLVVEGEGAFPRAPGYACGAERVFPGAAAVGDGGGEVREWWGAGDRAGGSERGGAPGGAAVRLRCRRVRRGGRGLEAAMVRGLMGKKRRQGRCWSERCSRQQTCSGWRGCWSTAWRHSGEG